MKSYLEEVDPEAAAELNQKEELRMAEERLKLRHGGHKKWARDMRRFKGHMENKDMREEYQEMMRTKNMLKDRQQTTQRAKLNEEDSEYGSESEDSQMSASELKNRAVDDIKGEMSDEQSGSSSEQSEDDSEDDSEN